MASLDPDNAIQTVVEQHGLRFTLIGTALFMSVIVYALVLAILQLTAAPPPAPEAPEDGLAFLPLLGLVLLGLSLTAVPVATFLMRRVLLKRDLPGAGLANGLDLPANASPAAKSTNALAVRFFTASLVATAFAEAPAIFALVLGLLLQQRGELASNSVGLVLVCGMGLWSAMLLALVIPTGGRLEDYLRTTTEGEAAGYVQDY